MKNSLILFLVFWTLQAFGQVNGMEVFQTGTKLAFYPNQCGNNIPEAMGKLSFCDKAGNLGVVERSYGLSGRGVKVMFANHQNQDEVYHTNNGISIRKEDGSWENIPNIAFPDEFTDFPIIKNAIVTPSGKMLISYTNNSYKLAIYNRLTKKVSIEKFADGYHSTLFVYDTDHNFTWVIARNGQKLKLYKYTDNLIEAYTLDKQGLWNEAASGAPIKYYNNHIYIGNNNGLFDINLTNYSVAHYNTTSNPSLPFDNVLDIEIGDNNELWLVANGIYDAAIVRMDLAQTTFMSYQKAIESNPNSNHRFRALAIDDEGVIWTTSDNENSILKLTLNGNNTVWDYLSKESFIDMGLPYTYAPRGIYAYNGKLYFITFDGSSGNNKNFEVLIKENENWHGRNDDDEGNLSQWMNYRFQESEPDDVGGVWWFNVDDDMVMYRNSNDEHKSINTKISNSAAIDVDQNAILTAGNPLLMSKIDFPSITVIEQTQQLGGARYQRVGDQIWVFSASKNKIYVYQSDNLVHTYELDENYENFYSFAVDDDNNAWFMKNSTSSGKTIRMFDTNTLKTTTYEREEKIGTQKKIVCGPDNAVWFIGYRGVMLFKNELWYSFLAADYPEFFNLQDAVVDENGFLYVLKTDLAEITTLSNPTGDNPDFNTISIEGHNSILPALKFYGPGTITIDSEGSIWTHASQTVFKIIDADMAREYQVPLLVGNKEIFLEDDVELRPNPTKGRIFVESKRPIDKLEIYSMIGRKLAQNRGNTIEVDLPSGLYLVKIYSRTQTTTKKLMIK